MNINMEASIAIRRLKQLHWGIEFPGTLLSLNRFKSLSLRNSYRRYLSKPGLIDKLDNLRGNEWECNVDVRLGEKEIVDLRPTFHDPRPPKAGSSFDRIKQLGYDENCGSGSFGSDFSHSDSDEGSDVEEEDGEASDDDYRVLDSCNGVSKGIVVDRCYERDESEFRHPLVREACRLIDLRWKWDPKLERELKNVLRRLSPRQVCAVLHLQADERVALNFFLWADRQWRYRQGPIVHYAMLQVLSKTKLCQGARRILRLMRRRGIRRTPEAFGYLMVSYGRAGHIRHAMRVLNMMQRAGVAPNLSICNTAVYVLVKGNRLGKALKFLERMQIVGIKPNVVTYNCLIKGYCDVQCVEDAIELIEDMPAKGCPPDKVSYYTVLSFLCKEKRIEDVRKLMERMENESGLFPDIVTYNTIIHMLSKNGYGDEAIDFVREAEEKGFRVDKVGYSAVITAFCHDGKMDKAKEMVNEMFDKGCNPDVVTYTTVVDGFCRIGKIDQAKKVLQQMYKHGCKPNTVSYTALLNGLCQSGNTSEAREMMNTSEEEWWTPNAITFSVVMHGFRKEGKLSDACNVVREMIAKGFFPTPVEINMLIQSLCREGKIDDARKFMQECLRKGCAVNVVNFTTVIHGFCKRNDLEAALSLLDDMYLINKHPDVFTYTVLVDALAAHDRFEEASELTMKMLRKGILPTPVTYRTVIHRYCQKGKTEDLLRLMDKMLSRQPYRTAYNQMIEMLCKFGFIDDAYKLLGEILKTASMTDARTCYVLMERSLNKGSLVLSYKVACRMFKRNLLPDLKLCEKLCKRLMLEGKLEEADSLMLRMKMVFIKRRESSKRQFGSIITAKRSEFLMHSDRLIEGVIRSVNNLLEKFHQSFFLYLLTGPSKFVSVGVYMIAFALLIAPLPVVAASLYSEAMKSDSTEEPENTSSSSISIKPSIYSRSWKWLHAAKLVFSVHSWAVIVSLLPYLICQIPNCTQTTSVLSWIFLSLFSLHFLYSMLGSPSLHPRASKPQNQEWAILKSVMISAAFIGLCLMSIVNYATAQIGALLLVPMCLMAQPFRSDLRAGSLKTYTRVACNLVLGFVGFPPAAFFLLKGMTGDFRVTNFADFWSWAESLWMWNSATYVYMLLVHLPCWVLCIHVLFYRC